MSIVVAAIERQRQRYAISIARLVRHAGINVKTYDAARKNPRGLRAGTAARIENALAELIANTPPHINAPLCHAMLRAVMAMLAAELGDDVRNILRQDFSVERPRNPEWLRASHLRRYAMSIISIDVDVGNAALARGIGCTRENVRAARDFTERHCDENPRLAAAIEKITTLVTGRDNEF